MRKATSRISFFSHWPIIVALALAGIACFDSSVYADSVPLQFRDETTFHSVHISQKELAMAIMAAHRLIREANAIDASKQFAVEHMTLVFGNSSVEIGNIDDDLESRLQKLDIPAATELSYDFQAEEDDRPISAVRIDFTDYHRQLDVTGTSREQVDAISSQLNSSFSSHEVTVSGSVARASLGVVAIFIAWALVTIGLSLAWVNKSVYPTIIAAGGFLIVFFVFELPWENFMPGTLITEQDPSFVVRYAAQMSVIGLILSVSFGIAGLFPLFTQSKANHKSRLSANNRK